jgi:hypothetical protein
MKKTIFYSTGILLALAACKNPSTKNEHTHMDSMESEKTSQSFKLDTTILKSGQLFYQCPMDLEVISDKPGSCPKCGMELEVVTKK